MLKGGSWRLQGFADLLDLIFLYLLVCFTVAITKYGSVNEFADVRERKACTI